VVPLQVQANASVAMGGLAFFTVLSEFWLGQIAWICWNN